MSKYNGITIIRLIQLKGSTICAGIMASQALCSYLSIVERFNNMDVSTHNDTTIILSSFDRVERFNNLCKYYS